tara:strand:+ start:75 stop:848 length:774 start_codon:yes stop_codon:yes gene_type:complete
MKFDKNSLIKKLNRYPYFYLIKNFEKKPELLKDKILEFSKNFNRIREQNKKGHLILEIKPNEKKIKLFKKKKKKIKSVLRYHQTNLGGSIHSDGPQLNQPPKYVVMACEHNAAKGGDSVLVNTQKIFKFLKNRKKEILNTLKKGFYFERRGFSYKNDNVFKKPIFSGNGKNFVFRYLRDYIEKGFELKNKNLNSSQIDSLNYLDSLLSNKNFSKILKLGSGDLLILNNHILAHGRTTFQISKKKKNKSRKLYRIWLH